MYKNYFKVGFRYLTRHKGYTAINLMGLAVGIACCLLIMLFVKSEWSFDRFHTKSERLYRAWLEEHYKGEVFTNTVTPIPLAPVLQAGIPEVQTTCRIAAFNTLVKYNGQSFNDPVNMVDSNFFDLFDFPLAEGQTGKALAANNALIITKKAATKYFGTAPAIGKNLELQLGNDKVLFTVQGVAENIPYHSSIQFDLLIPFSNAHYLYSPNAMTRGWSNVSVESYVLLKNKESAAVAQAKIPSILDPIVADNYKPGEYIVRLQPMRDIHLNNALPAGNVAPTDPKYAYILATIGLLILLIACINFVILSVGRSTTRAMEVGVRKVLGAYRKQLLQQYWMEALLLTFFAFVLGIGLALVFQKSFNQLANRQLALSFDAFTILFCLLLILVIGLLAGIYPALVLSKFKPIQVLKGKLASGGMGFFRKTMVVGQFVASIVMITGTIAVGKQLDYLRNKDLGYNKEHVVIIPTNKSRKEGTVLGERFKLAMARDPEVINSTISLFSMTEPGWMNMGYTDDKTVFRQFRFNVIDADFVPAMGLTMAAGQNFSGTNSSDSNYILVNEALVREYGWKDPLGQRLPGKYTQRVLGVVKDFNFESLHTTVKPLVMAIKPDSIFRQSSDVSMAFAAQPRISIRFRPGNLKQHMEQLQKTWKTVAGDQDFEFRFLDDALNAAYEQEQRLGNIVRYASFLSIFIACMGLFGLATLVVVRRTKEIGIRKVLGADIGRIVFLVAKDFVLLVLVASVIALPIAWWALHRWLEDFAYRTRIPVWIFGAAAVIALLIAICTVGVQAIRAARANPVKSLRME